MRNLMSSPVAAALHEIRMMFDGIVRAIGRIVAVVPGTIREIETAHGGDDLR